MDVGSALDGLFTYSSSPVSLKSLKSFLANLGIFDPKGAAFLQPGKIIQASDERIFAFLAEYNLLNSPKGLTFLSQEAQRSRRCIQEQLDFGHRQWTRQRRGLFSLRLCWLSGIILQCDSTFVY